jgi:hypothetical protein
MRTKIDPRLERGRVVHGQWGSELGSMSGAFRVLHDATFLAIIASEAVDGSLGWEHVSVSTRTRTPTWEEMCWVKGLFWSDEECVLQFHPAKKDYVNNHPHCLHMWKPPHPVVLPPREFV